MEINETYYLFKIKEELDKRQRKNSSYSLRAFAKDIEMDPSNLSGILRNKRGLPPNRAEGVAKKLGLSPKEKALFLNSVQRKKTKLDQIQINPKTRKYLLDDIYFKIISEWEYFALLELMNLKSFQSNINWISKKLGITQNRLDIVIKNLVELGFIEIDKNGDYIKKTPMLETSDDVESQALQKSHEENMEIAAKKLKEIEVSLRDFSSITIGVTPARIKEAKAIIREFQDKLKSLMENEENSEVYIFNSQFFPVTGK